MNIIRKPLGHIINEVAETYPDNDALIHTETGLRYTYTLFSWQIERAARGMIKLGIQKGDRVAIWAPNIPEWIIAQMALAMIGAILVPVDPGAGKDELHYILEQSDSKAIFLAGEMEEEEYVDIVLSEMDNLPGLQNAVVFSDRPVSNMILWTELTAMGDDAGAGVFNEMVNGVRPDDPIAIMYTSGTTGRPKGVVVDHSGLINKSMFSTERQGINNKDRLCLFFPLFHMFGNTCIAMAGFLRGATIVMPSRNFDPPAVLSAIHKERCTAIYASPSMIIALVDYPKFDKKHWKTVRKGTIGGAPCPMELMKKLVRDIGVSKITVSYGITETSSWITMTRPDDPLELRVSTIGTPLECNEVKIVNPLTGEDLPPGSQGELCTRGFLMKEYYKMPAATAAAVDRDGWFHSGDLGEIDENGYVKITGRLKDVIVREGIEIYPTELEEVFYNLPEVSEVQVFGFSHPEKGQEIAAWVKLKEGMDVSPGRLEAYADEKLEKEKRPDYFKIVSGFPMTRSGKVQKFRLAEMAEKEYIDR